jgi:hypothetical protein
MAYSLGMRALRIPVKPLPLAVAAMATALVSALAGCGGGGPAADGPVSSGNSMHGPIPRGSQCVPGGRPQAFGFDSFTNYGHTTVILDRVVLAQVRVLAWVVRPDVGWFSRPDCQRLPATRAMSSHTPLSPGEHGLSPLFTPNLCRRLLPSWAT